MAVDEPVLPDHLFRDSASSPRTADPTHMLAATALNPLPAADAAPETITTLVDGEPVTLPLVADGTPNRPRVGRPSAGQPDEPPTLKGARSRSSVRKFRRLVTQIWSENREMTGTAMLSTDEVDLRHGRAVVDLAARVAAAALGAGAAAADSTALLLRVTQHYKLTVHADVTMSSVTISYFRSLEGDPISVLRTVAAKTTDYRKLQAVEELVERITTDSIGLTQARHEIAGIAKMPRTYRRWVQSLAKGILGFWVAALFGGDLIEALVAGFATTAVDGVMRVLARIKAPTFFGQVAGASTVGIVALLVMWARSATTWAVDISPSLIVAAGMISMLAGLSLTTAVRDAIDGYFVTASARLVEVATLTGGIVLGLTLTLWVGLELGVPAYLSPSTGVKPVWWLQVIASALIAVAFAINNHLPPRTWALTACFGLLAWLIGTGAGSRIATNAALAGAAAFACGLLAAALARAARVPSIALVNAGVVSLVPGMALYRGLLGLVQISQGAEVSYNSFDLLFQALMIAVMLAAGASLGTIVGRPLSMPQDWQTRLALGRAWERGRGQRDV
ncbi:threonine/serine ThrE exporter family protein [Propionibacteriaceae bacterium G1746]|uniref:threonine/serine ThrE exporter family protein n=1 Tax=Aestuariimicrobium sp. G57 TaxID=3418485 RepID=UPI003C14E7C7